MVTTQQLLDLFARRQGKALSLRDLQAAFDLDAGGRKELARHLKQLERSGVLCRAKGGKYAAPRSGRTLKGALALHRGGFAFVTPDGTPGPGDIFVPARYVRPAMHGDRVLIAVERGSRGGRPEGRVLRVLERAHVTLLGRINVRPDGFRLQPLDPQLRDSFLVPAGALGSAREGDVVIARIETYPERVRQATAMVIEVLGAADDPAVEIRVAAERFGITEPELIARLKRLLDEKILTRFGPMYHAERMGGGLALAAMKDGPVVRECHNVTGAFEYLLRVEVADLPAYKRFHADVLGGLPQVSMITSYIVMDSPKDGRG